ncbi:ABC-2 transporter permease [Acetatifactor aquisgranensis]|uniref:ABC-2 transporter permease n=1 Tax=Acetatifactor aquisgranensis TaxID=2941233 RepID=UPI00203E9B2F|nr:ABC-2 transporter permease [Acetatifactor aquisgranensis]
MLRMLRLNWSAMKCYRIRFLIIPGSLFVTRCFSPVLLVPMGTFLLFSFSLNPFAIEEKGDLNRLYLTLPVQRRTIVTGRYVLSFLLFAAGALLGLAMMPLANLVSFSKWYPGFSWKLALVSFSFLFYGVMSLAMYPLLFKVGYQKGKVWGYYVPALLVCLAYIALIEYDMLLGNGTFIFDLLVYASDHILIVSGGMFTAGGILLALSYLLSARLYGRREF